VLAHVPPEGIRLTALAERARITKQAMAELVGDLVRLGYLRRATDPDDRRAKRIELTDRGAKSAAAARRALAAIETELGERITPKRLRQLRRALLGALDGVAPG
jgi:DNA-binding MarR family transcriptional regulator